MNRVLVFAFCCCVVLACRDRSKAVSQRPGVKSITAESKKPVKQVADYPRDSVISLFNDSSYRFRVHVFDTSEMGGYDDVEANSTATLTYAKSGRSTVLFKDSIYCSRIDIRLVDMNNDHVKDVMVLYYSSARSNRANHLYLVDEKKHNLSRVKGFEEVLNPILNSVDNIIESMSISGILSYSFYRISKRNTLIDLGHSFETDEGMDDGKYEHALKKILKEKKQ